MATLIPLHVVPFQFQDPVTSVNLSGGSMEFFLAGTTTPTQLYSDVGGTLVGTSVALNSGGFPQSGGNTVTLFRDQTIALKLVLKNAVGAVIFTVDDIPAVSSFDSTSAAKLAAIEALADVTDAANVGAVVNGKHTMFIRASDMRPTVTAPCSVLTDVETTAGRPDMQVLDFADGADDHAQFQVAFPKQWGLGTLTYQVFWTSTAADTDGVTWGLQGVAVSDNETIDVDYGSPVLIDDANQGAAEELLVSAESAVMTLAGTPADDDMCFFRIFRDVSDPNDTATEAARLLGIKLFYTTDALNDA